MKKIVSFLMLIVFLIAGCTHSLRITNEEDLSVSSSRPLKTVKIGFFYTGDKLINSAIEEISLNSAVEIAKKDYQLGSGIAVDYVSDLSQNTKYSASGQNFFITFPGFIVFTHAWLGYRYYVDINTQSKLLTPDGKLLSETTITTPYKIRYTSFARGAASSLIGWFTPGYGALDIIPGLIFSVSYDHRATNEFIEQVKPSYKAFVSSKIFEQIANLQRTASSEPKSYYRMEPVVIGDEIKGDTNDRSFAIHIMKLEDGQLAPLSSTIKELPEETYQLLDKIAKKEIIPGTNDLKNIIFSFAISDMPFPKDMESVSIYTMQGDKIVALFEGSGEHLKVAKE
jgi:hypothetical protein